MGARGDRVLPKPLLLLGIGVATSWLLGYNLIYARQGEQVRLTQARSAEERATQQMQVEVAALLEQLERSSKRLPPKPDPASLAHEVLELVQRFSVQVTSITREAPQELAGFTRLAVSLRGTASYHQLGTLVDALERSERFMRVERLKVERPADGQPLDFQMVISTLYVPPLLPGSRESGS